MNQIKFLFTYLSPLPTLIVGLIILGCDSKQSASPPASSPTLTMGLSADYRPFEFRKEGDIVGLDVDIAKEITHRLGYTLKIQDMDFNAVLPALQSGLVDFVMSGMTVTEERKKNVDFSNIYYHSSFVLLAKKDAHFSKEQDLSGKKIGVQLGTTMETLGKQKAKGLKNITIISLSKNTILIEELKAGRIDAVIIEKVQAQAFSRVNPVLHYCELTEWSALSEDGYAIAFSKNPKNDLKLRIRFDQVLDQLKQEGKLNQITKKWLE